MDHTTSSAILSTPSLHLYQSAAFSFLEPILVMFPSTCSLYFILGRPCLRCLSTSCTISLIKHLPQVVSNHDHIPLHYLPFPGYLLLPSIPTCPSAALYSFYPQTFTPHIALTIDLSALFKIATTFSLKPHVSVP